MNLSPKEIGRIAELEAVMAAELAKHPTKAKAFGIIGRCVAEIAYIKDDAMEAWKVAGYTFKKYIRDPWHRTSAPQPGDQTWN